MSEQHPKQLEAYGLARMQNGLKEIPGAVDEPRIVQFFADVGHDWVQDDETAWCAAFLGAMLERTGLRSTRKLNARSYLEWGEPVSLDRARPGDVAVFTRGDPNGWQGHVAFFVSLNGNAVRVLGGNQRNAVNVAAYSRNRLLGIRRMPAPKPTSVWQRVAQWFRKWRNRA